MNTLEGEFNADPSIDPSLSYPLSPTPPPLSLSLSLSLLLSPFFSPPPRPPSPVVSVHWYNDDRHILTSGLDSQVIRWDLKHPEGGGSRKDGEYTQKGTTFVCAVPSTDGASSFCLGDDQVLKEIEFPSGMPLNEMDSNVRRRKTSIEHPYGLNIFSVAKYAH